MTLLEDMEKYAKEKLPLDLKDDNVFIDFRPDEPNNLVVFSEYQGSPVALGLDDFTNRSVQILVRDSSTKNARDLIWKLFKLFNNAETRVIELPDRFTMMYPRQTPFKLSVDNKQRTLYVFNLGVSTKFD